MATALVIPVSQPTRGGGNASGFTGSALLSGLASDLGTAKSLTLPVSQPARAGNNPNPYILTLLEVVVSGANCPPSAVYPAYGVRGVGASRAP
jgi:hypothetical protein